MNDDDNNAYNHIEGMKLMVIMIEGKYIKHCANSVNGSYPEYRRYTVSNMSSIAVPTEIGIVIVK